MISKGETEAIREKDYSSATLLQDLQPDQAGLLQSCFYGKKPLTKLHETLSL
jgi:hypothetical protein